MELFNAMAWIIAIFLPPILLLRALAAPVKDGAIGKFHN